MIVYRLFIALMLVSLTTHCTPYFSTPKASTKSKYSAITAPINRKQWVSRHNPTLKTINPQSPFTLGNGRFAFTADSTGLQSLPELYFSQGIPLETKARWAWHTYANPQDFTLNNSNEAYSAYGRTVNFPTRMDAPAGQWLRQNPHDFPLAQIGFLWDQKPLIASDINNVTQQLDMWRGVLNSQFNLKQHPVAVATLVDSTQDCIAAQVLSPALKTQQLTLSIKFPRGYDLNTKNTPAINWQDENAHQTEILQQNAQHALIKHTLDDTHYYASIHWQGHAQLKKLSAHHFLLISQTDNFKFSINQTQNILALKPAFNFETIKKRTETAWEYFWRSGAAVDLSQSTHGQAQELERRIVLSRYLMAVQERAEFPPQETGLTSSSWYGKHHSEMAFWHSAHWILWGNPKEAEQLLNWYKNHLSSAQTLAQARGLNGARWAKMVGPNNRESPGGNPLIIWNQPQVIHLAELIFQRTQDDQTIKKYSALIEETAAAMASMLTWDNTQKRYNLAPPIWIAQEIYDPKRTQNPTFELAYWRMGLNIAQEWRKRQGLEMNADWQKKIDQLASLPIKNNLYVAIESIPDTFENPNSRRDHPSMVAALGLLNDPKVDKKIMANTLDAVINTWDWGEKIWGWDYPMLAMTAARLNKPDLAVQLLLKNSTHNQYLPNGHAPQAGAKLPVYLPANGALLTAVAMMLGGWQGAQNTPYPGFPKDNTWVIKAEGFTPY
ncbi:MAG: hypothetical protein RL497_1645 [Pseudomonadota bacterium]